MSTRWLLFQVMSIIAPSHGTFTKIPVMGEWLAEGESGNRLRCFDYQGLFDPDLLRTSGELEPSGGDFNLFGVAPLWGGKDLCAPPQARGGKDSMSRGIYSCYLDIPSSLSQCLLIAVCRLYPAQNQTGTILSLQHVSVGHASASADIHQGILVVLLVIYGTNVTPATTVVVRKQGKKNKISCSHCKMFL